jgi:hypothetical protein
MNMIEYRTKRSTRARASPQLPPRRKFVVLVIYLCTCCVCVLHISQLSLVYLFFLYVTIQAE